MYSADFQINLKKTINPYGNGGASKEIIKIINKVNLDNVLKKKFHDINEKFFLAFVIAIFGWKNC